MSLLICSNRGQVDKYASAKSMGQFSLAASLIVDDIKDLYDSVLKGPDQVNYFWALVVVIGLSLLLQLLATIFSVILYFKRYPRYNKHEKVDKEVEMNASPDGGGEENHTGRSTDNIGVQFEGGRDLDDPLPPLVMRRLNDGLTIIAVVVGILHLLKNGLHPSTI